MSEALARSARRAVLAVVTLYVFLFVAPLGLLWLWDHPHNPLFIWASVLGWTGSAALLATTIWVWVVARKPRTA